MGLISDFFVATQTELADMDASASPAALFPSVQAKRVEVVKLVQLQCLLDGSTFDQHLNNLDSFFVKTVSDDGPWVLLVPQVIIERLALAEPEMLSQIGTAWAKTDEWIADQARPAEIIELITQIAALARRAKEERQMYLWVTL
jgi:hypothetical protein